MNIDDSKSELSKCDYFPDLESIVLCEFDSIVGPRISCCFPAASSVEDEVFRRVYHFLIIKRNDLCENGISWTDDISGQTLAGYPVLIENSKYARNALIYNVCLVGNRQANVSLLLCMAEKLARLLKSAELQSGFMSNTENRAEKLATLMADIYKDLKSKGETRRILDGSFPFFVALPRCRLCQMQKKKRLNIKPSEVPYLRLGPSDEKWSITDCVGKKIVKHIDGHCSVAQLAAKLPVPYSTVVAVISQLVRLDLIRLRPTVNDWDMYTVTSKLRLLLTDNDLRARCVKESTLTNTGAVLIEPAPFDVIIGFLTQLQHGITIGDLKQRNKSIAESIDITKLVLFALENKLLKRVFISPVYTPAEQRPSGASIAGTEAESVFGLSNSMRSDLNSSTQSARPLAGLFSTTSMLHHSTDDSHLDQAYRLMDGNHPLEFIAAKAAMDPGDLLRTVRADVACELLLR